MAMLARQWEQVEITLRATGAYANAYTDVDVWAVFRHEDGTEILRPGFWDGGDTWRVRFASPKREGKWTWKSFSSPADGGLNGAQGEIASAPTQSPNRFHRHGFWKIPAGGRNLVHADGRPALIVGDTAWALPWRATQEECLIYAKNRQEQGFNAALLMSVQPDMKAVGPRSRTEHDGFDVGFEDLPTGHITQMNISYFQYMDGLIKTLVDHEIVPVYQPVFHGYGWKGLQVAGPVIPPHEYARYCRYLVARFGAMPAIWLVGGDGDGLAPGVDPAGWEIERWDAYAQPTGIHYAPHQNPWAYQDRAWLDFQWCQTGHNGEHVPERVARMWEQRPIKAVANGEPTYEHIGAKGRAEGWWQGHEAWCNLCAGGTMGVVYGAGSLWQWRRDKKEVHQEWCMAGHAGWREAIEFEGAKYIGMVGQIFDGLPFEGMEPDYLHTYGRRGLLVPGKLFVVYVPAGGDLGLCGRPGVPSRYKVIDPKTGKVMAEGDLGDNRFGVVKTGTDQPRVVVFCNQ